jgi:hypothetical protein
MGKRSLNAACLVGGEHVDKKARQAELRSIKTHIEKLAMYMTAVDTSDEPCAS